MLNCVWETDQKWIEREYGFEQEWEGDMGRVGRDRSEGGVEEDERGRGGEEAFELVVLFLRVQAEVQIHGAALEVVEGLSP